jgi:hypothetical protein
MLSRKASTASNDAPPIMLPIRPVIEKITSSTPAWVMPTLNYRVTYREKKGKIIVPPRRSMNDAPMSVQKVRGYSL